MKRIVLVSAPWPLFNRPSIQLGALKAYLNRYIPQLRIDSSHFYLCFAKELGYEVYETVSTGMWRAEVPFAALLFPEKKKEAERFFSARMRGTPFYRRLDFGVLTRRLNDISLTLLSGIKWDDYLMVGISACLGQLTSSLYLATEIRKRAPEILIAMGGSACAGEMGLSIVKTFPVIDCVINGEGEKPLLALAEAAMEGAMPSSKPTQGIVTRNTKHDEIEPVQISDLDSLPLPDFSDYFGQLAAIEANKSFIPRLPIEASRGCWWKGASGARVEKAQRGCAFCNLNLQWSGYRAKSIGKIGKEVEILTQRHRTLSLSFMDNSIPYTKDADLFKEISSLGLDLRLFCETRAGVSLEVLKSMTRAGINEIQAGIEALSTSLLKKLNKGMKTIDNIELMRNCESSDAPSLNSNLIMEFPSSDQTDVEETLRAMDFSLPFSPPKGICFWLGFGSPVWSNPVAFNITLTGNHQYYRHFFPTKILSGLFLMIQGYKAEKSFQKNLWAPVRKKLVAWTKSYRALHSARRREPILSHQDGGDFLIIRQRRSGSADMVHRLEGTSRRIYLFCERQRSLSEILGTFEGIAQDNILIFLRMMEDKRLMFSEGDKYLTLSLRAHWCQDLK